MGWTFLKAVLILCFASLPLVACSEEPHRPDRREDDASERTMAEGTERGDATRPPGYAEHTVEGTVLRKDERFVSVEEVQLQRVEDGDEIAVLATIRGPREYGRDCFLLEERAWLAMQRSFESGVWREDALRNVDAWEDDLRPPDVTSGGSTYTKFFYEDEETPDPRETPYFVFCYKEDDASDGGGGPMVWYDVAHVEGTPGSS